MSTDCLIRFDHPYAIYNSGNTLNGHVKLETRKLKSIRGISIKIIGVGQVYWRESKNRSYSAHEQYLNSVTYVVGSASGQPFDFTPGIYQYTFSCELPIQLPTSMKEANCIIQYEVIVTIDRRLRFDNVFKKEFTVNHISDLNFMSIVRIPRKNVNITHINRIFSLCFHDAGNIRAELEVTSDGFIPGQLIPFKLIVFNNSNIPTTETVVKLLNCCIVESAEPYVEQNEIRKELMMKYFTNTPRYSNKEFKDFFYLPYLPPSHYTKYIRLEYKVIAKISSGYMKKLHVELPVTIGTIPLPEFDPNKPITVLPMKNGDTIDSTPV